MNSKRFLIKLQFLGFRYHGVQKQPEFQSIQGKIEAYLVKDLIDIPFKTRFSSRTDAMVSAEETYCLVMFEEEIPLTRVNSAFISLPQDIRVLEVKAVADKFTLMKHATKKEYHYYFTFNQNGFHPFCAPLMCDIKEKLDLELMKKGAKLFLGTHHFQNYAFKPKPGTEFVRTILKSEIVNNNFLQASFFPKESYTFCVEGKGFMRGQVRLMMGALFRLGKKEISLEDLKVSLEKEDPHFVKWMAPASGLILHKTELK